MPPLSIHMATRKLLILDLNGTLLLRPKSRRAHVRPVHPRPFMPAFRSFLFHAAVKAWLEVRVWSSAQPHNVDQMVECCFGDRRSELKAVWARDTMDLAEEDYSRKSQTTKDLEKHWSVDLGGGYHSAKTTLLLDDSPRKARLQPHNHLCIPEYTQNLRNRDLDTKKNIENHLKEGVNGQSYDGQIDPKRSPNFGFDLTLIAVIGVLDELRGQTNVANWIRSGGLWAGLKPATGDDEMSSANESEDDALRKTGVLSHGDAQQREEAPMWFDYEPCFQYWVDRGVRAAEALSISLEHGIDK